MVLHDWGVPASQDDQCFGISDALVRLGSTSQEPTGAHVCAHVYVHAHLRCVKSKTQMHARKSFCTYRHMNNQIMRDTSMHSCMQMYMYTCKFHVYNKRRCEMVHASWPGGANRHRCGRLLWWRVAPWKGATVALRSGEGDSCWVKDGWLIYRG